MNPSKIFRLLALPILLLTSTMVFAQGRQHTVIGIQQGTFVDLGGTQPLPTDSLGVSDTTVYTIPITHTNLIFPYMTWEWTKVGAGSATIVLSFTQSTDGVNYFPVLKGQAQSAYTKTYSSLAASTNSEVEFWRDTAVIGGRYLKVTWISSSTASVKGKLHARVKTNVQ